MLRLGDLLLSGVLRHAFGFLCLGLFTQTPPLALDFKQQSDKRKRADHEEGTDNARLGSKIPLKGGYVLAAHPTQGTANIEQDRKHIEPEDHPESSQQAEGGIQNGNLGGDKHPGSHIIRRAGGHHKQHEEDNSQNQSRGAEYFSQTSRPLPYCLGECSVVHLLPAGDIDGAVLHVGEPCQALPGAVSHAGDGVVGHVGLDTGVGLDQLVKAPDQGAASGHDDAVGGNVGHKLGGGTFQNRVDRLQYADGGFLKGLDHLAGSDGENARQAGHEAAALDFHRLLLGTGEDAADLQLELFRSTFADQHVMLTAYVLDDGLVKLVARDFNGTGFYDAGERNHGDIGSTAADIHHHVPVWLGDVDARSDGGGQRLLDQEHLTRARLDARVNDGALFHLGDAGGYADHDPGLKKAESAHLADELLKHPLGHIVVGDDTLPQGTDGHDVARRAAQHHLCVGPNLEEPAGIFIDRHNGRFTQNDPFAFHVNQNGSCAKVDPNILHKHSYTSKTLSLTHILALNIRD
ncbi:hypothetical protein SDC9_58074 [bioreactor metagenome]|uniref:Uncharacterized protein n=1 Tax=bioreactor metagenome TaxID=1076179 RepID=A0A644XC28_9ZZZZ